VSRTFALRALETQDLDVVSALHGEAFAVLGERGWTSAEIADLLASPGAAGVLLQDDAEPVGFALCRAVADEAELLTIAVRADRRRYGAGRALVDKVIDLARERGAHSLFLEVGADNAAALALYERVGFRRVGRRVAYYRRRGRPPADAVVMRLAIV
jgi:ribosomal-protein-alanine N-acetyltransferase